VADNRAASKENNKRHRTNLNLSAISGDSVCYDADQRAGRKRQFIYSHNNRVLFLSCRKTGTSLTLTYLFAACWFDFCALALVAHLQRRSSLRHLYQRLARVCAASCGDPHLACCLAQLNAPLLKHAVDASRSPLHRIKRAAALAASRVKQPHRIARVTVDSISSLNASLVVRRTSMLASSVPVTRGTRGKIFVGARQALRASCVSRKMTTQP